jgi:pimeloyl-ACP methyl ester carboxylesterase
MKKLLTVFILLITCAVHAQLKPGYDKQEYLELLRISRKQFEPKALKDSIPAPTEYKMLYRSPVGPLKNRWDLWFNAQKTAVISIMGSTNAQESWLENFYSAMVPANGQLQLNDSVLFKYKLAQNPKATVHIGWLLGMAYLSTSVIQQINKAYAQNGIKNFIIMGHSQGAAIAYLLRSYLADMQAKKIIPADIAFKTYCSAPPKPGNVYYAYDYEYLTAGGWGIAVTNAADWVPQTPFSIQTMDDFNDPNPFANAKDVIKKQPFFVRLYANHVFNRLKKTPKKAQKTYEDYLGHLIYKFIKKSMPQFKEPAYSPNGMFTRTGTPVILMPNEQYKAKFVYDAQNIFLNHDFGAYYYLAYQQQ